MFQCRSSCCSFSSMVVPSMLTQTISVLYRPLALLRPGLMESIAKIWVNMQFILIIMWRSLPRSEHFFLIYRPSKLIKVSQLLIEIEHIERFLSKTKTKLHNSIVLNKMTQSFKYLIIEIFRLQFKVLQILVSLHVAVRVCSCRKIRATNW